MSPWSRRARWAAARPERRWEWHPFCRGRPWRRCAVTTPRRSCAPTWMPTAPVWTGSPSARERRPTAARRSPSAGGWPPIPRSTPSATPRARPGSTSAPTTRATWAVAPRSARSPSTISSPSTRPRCCRHSPAPPSPRARCCTPASALPTCTLSHRSRRDDSRAAARRHGRARHGHADHPPRPVRPQDPRCARGRSPSSGGGDAEAPGGMWSEVGAEGRSVVAAPSSLGRPALIVTGARHPVGSARSEVALAEGLAAWARRTLPVGAEIARWSGQDYQAHNLVPFVGGCRGALGACASRPGMPDGA